MMIEQHAPEIGVTRREIQLEHFANLLEALGFP